MSKATDIVFRVVRLPDSLRRSMRTTRDAQSQTNEVFVADAVKRNLPTIVATLGSLGFCGAESAQPTRLPFSESAGTLKDLRIASDTLGIAATKLLAACVRMQVAGPTNKRRGSRRGKPSSKKPSGRCAR